LRDFAIGAGAIGQQLFEPHEPTHHLVSRMRIVHQHFGYPSDVASSPGR
jgi:hypothetical protein